MKNSPLNTKAVLVVLLTLQNLAVPGFSFAADDGLKPMMPRVNLEDVLDMDGPAATTPTKGSGGNNANSATTGSIGLTPKKPLVQPDNSVRGFKLDNNAVIRVADVSEEFACPLFQGKAYQSVMNSLEKLSDSMKSTIQCNNSPTMSSVVDNTKKIKTAISTLEPYFENPDTAYDNLGAIEASITSAVSGMDTITQSLAASSFQTTDCGKNIAVSTGVASSLSSLVTSLGPFALLGISMAPGLGLAIKAGALAIVAGASTYNEYQKLIYGQTIDMADHEQWKAVVQNTCAYSRIVRKMNYVQRYESGLIPNVPDNSPKDLTHLPTDIQMKVIAFDQKYANNVSLAPFVQVSKIQKIRTTEMADILKAGRIELSRFSGQIGNDVKANPEIACSVGLELARLAQNKTGFPNDVVKSIDLLGTENTTKVQQRYIGLISTYERLVNGFAALNPQALNSSAAVNECAIKTGSLIGVLNQTLTTYASISQGLANEKESQLLKNPEYKKWKEEAKLVESQKNMGQQLYSVMKNISDSSAILRSYLNRRQNELRTVLFGPSSFWNVTNSKAPPVYKWLDYTLKMHKASVAELMKNFRAVQDDLLNLNARLLKVDKKLLLNSDMLNITDKKYAEAFSKSIRFEGLDIKNFNMKDSVSAREQQLVCNRLLNTWDNWVQATNHLDSLGVFCDMIDPLIDVTTDKGIIKFCRGSNLDVKVVDGQVSDVSIAAQKLLMKDLV